MKPADLPLMPHIFGHARTLMTHSMAAQGLGHEDIVREFRKRRPDGTMPDWDMAWNKIVRDIVIYGAKR